MRGGKTVVFTVHDPARDRPLPTYLPFLTLRRDQEPGTKDQEQGPETRTRDQDQGPGPGTREQGPGTGARNVSYSAQPLCGLQAAKGEHAPGGINKK